jgi:hypothetical protein
LAELPTQLAALFLITPSLAYPAIVFFSWHIVEFMGDLYRMRQTIAGGGPMKAVLLRNYLGLGSFVLILINGCVSIKEHPHIDNPSHLNSATHQPDRAATGNAGMVVDIDPKTGRLISPSAALPGQLPESSVETAKQPASELNQTLSPAPGGGVMIQLDERFLTPLTTTIGSDGKVRSEHDPNFGGLNASK